MNFNNSIKQDFVYRFALFIFLTIQPFKIVSALSHFNFGYLIALPFVVYVPLIIKNKIWLVRHFFVLSIQIFFMSISFIFSNFLYLDLLYFYFFLLSPHFLLLISHTYTPNSYRFTINAFLVLLFFMAVLSSISISMYGQPILHRLTDVISFESLSRNSTESRLHILEALNIGKNIFNLDYRVLEGTALTIYPLVAISFIFLLAQKFTSKEIILFFLAFIFILLKNSRAELIYFFMLAFAYLFSFRWPRFTLYSFLLLLPFPFIQIVYPTRFLNGRQPLNDLFVNHFNFIGKGIGFTRSRIIEITKGDYGSMHNIHFELILNFGILGYVLFLFLFFYFFIKFDIKAKILSLALLFFLLATNYEFFDIYTAFLLGLICHGIFIQIKPSIESKLQNKGAEVYFKLL